MSSGSGAWISLRKVLADGLVKAGWAISQLTGVRFATLDVSFMRHPLWDLSDLFNGSADGVAASFFEVRGNLQGYLLLIAPRHDLSQLMALLFGTERYDQALADSAFGELGNVVGSAFLNHLADSYHLFAVPTAPQVVHDMVGALLNPLAAGVAAGDESMPFMVRARFAGVDTVPVVSTDLVWLPGAGVLDRLAAAS